MYIFVKFAPTCLILTGAAISGYCVFNLCPSVHRECWEIGIVFVC
jgi:hypothetical protein